MFFDRLCGIAERHDRKLCPLLNAARIFQFPGRAHEVLPTATKEVWNFMAETFFLPFPVVAVEDTGSCILLWQSEPDQRGFDQPYYFAECLPIIAETAHEFADGHTAEEQEAIRDAIRSFPPRTCVVTAGVITCHYKPDEDPNKLLFEGALSRCFLASKREMVVSPAESKNVLPIFQSPAIRNAGVALKEVAYFNTPNRFVVQRTPKKVLVPKGDDRAVRSPHRPGYTLLTPGEIRVLLKSETPGDGKTPTPHSRRRHMRHLSSERFKAMKGKDIVIPATWVGPSEGEVGGQKYKICLDL